MVCIRYSIEILFEFEIIFGKDCSKLYELKANSMKSWLVFMFSIRFLFAPKDLQQTILVFNERLQNYRFQSLHRM